MLDEKLKTDREGLKKRLAKLGLEQAATFNKLRKAINNCMVKVAEFQQIHTRLEVMAELDAVINEKNKQTIKKVAKPS